MAVFYGGLSVTFRDELKLERSINFPIQLTVTDPTQIDAAVGVFLTALDAPVLARVVSAKLKLDIDLTSATIKVAPQAGSNIKTGATMSMRDSEGNRHPVFIPAMDNSKFLDGGVLNDSDVEVAAIRNSLDNSVVVTSGTTTIEFLDEDRRKFEQYVKGFRTTRK